MITAPRYIELLDELAVEGKETFTTQDIEELGHLSPQAASNLLTRLVRRGLVDRVARGRYAMRPFGALGTRAAAEDIALAVGAVFADKGPCLSTEGGREGRRITPIVTHQQIADMVGTSRETVTRALKGLKQEGWLAQEGKRYVVPMER